MTQSNILGSGLTAQTERRSRTAAGAFTSLLLALLAMPAWALEIVPAADGNGDGYRFELLNRSGQPLDRVRLDVDSGHLLNCGTQTQRGAAFARDATLAAGDRVSCQTRPLAGRWQGAVVASGRQPDGHRIMVRSSFGRGGPIAIDQGVVAVLAGSIHADGNSNGVLDAAEGIDYTYTVLNLGNQGLSGLALTDLSGVVTCPAATLAVGAHMTCARAYTISATDAGEGLVLNEVEVTGNADNGDPVQAVDVDVRFNLAGNAGIVVIKSPFLAGDADGSGHASEGDLIEYTFVVKNADALTLSSVDLVEPDPTLIDGPITCQAQTLSGAAFVLGSGSLASLDGVLCTATHVITAAEAAAGEARNLVEAHGQPPFGPAIVGTGASLVVIPAGTPQVAVTKLANVGSSAPNGTVVYTITVTNVGDVAVTNLGISDPLPDGVTAFSWTCAGSGGAVCPVASGAGAIAQTVPSLPVGGALTYSVTATLAANPPDPVLNVVMVTPEDVVLCQPEGTPSPCQADIPVTIETGTVTPPLPVPASSPWSVLLMVGLMLLMAAALRRRRLV